MPRAFGRERSLRRQEQSKSGRSEDSRSLLWQTRTPAARLGAAIAQQTCVTEGLHKASLCHKASRSASHKMRRKSYRAGGVRRRISRRCWPDRAAIVYLCKSSNSETILLYAAEVGSLSPRERVGVRGNGRRERTMCPLASLLPVRRVILLSRSCPEGLKITRSRRAGVEVKPLWLCD